MRTRAERTRASAEWQLARLCRHFGDVRIHRITEELWCDYVERELGRRPRKFYDDRKYMLRVLRFAVKKGLLERVPELPIPDLPSDVGRALSPRELVALERHAGPTLRLQIRIAWKTGLRLREMLGLRWEQIDFERHVIRLRPGDTKMRRERQTPVPADLMRELRRWKARAAGQNVFPSPTGRGSVRDNKTAWRACRAAAGVTARWHDLRHTAATLLVANGIPERLICLYLSMSPRTLRRYTHVTPESLELAAEATSDARARPRGRRRLEAAQIRELVARYPAHVLRAAAAMRMAS